MFIECFTNKLLRFYSKENHKSNSIELLHGYLIEMNYNSSTYLNYLTFKFSVELSNRQNVEAKLLVLYSWLKSVNQIKSEAQKFFNYFESNGWLVGGKTKMKNWNAAARNWILNSQKWNSSEAKQSGNLHTNQDKDYSIPL